MSTSIGAEQLRTEYLHDPLGLDVRRPRFSWVVSSDRRGCRQGAYHLVVATRPGLAASGVGDAWDSGRVPSNSTAHIEYEGAALAPKTPYWWSVQIWAADGVASGWSEEAHWETGMLEPSEWTARWVAAPAAVRAPAPPIDEVDLTGRVHERPSWIRTTFDVPGPVRRARAYVTARGVYELHLNGTRVGDDVFTPGWTDYGRRIQYQTYDVTARLAHGENEVGALLGDGWFCGRVAWEQRIYGEHPSLLVQLEVELEDGATFVVASDEAWLAAPSHLRWSDMLTGEVQEVASPSPREWSAVDLEGAPEAELVGQHSETVRRLRELEPIGVVEIAPGRFVIDFGQNLVGWVRFAPPPGATGVLSVRHAEMLDAGGGLYTDNYRAAQCVDAYVIGDTGVADGRVLEPHFTWRGFRYAEIAGLPEGVAPPMVRAVVVGSDTPVTGRFECSSAMVNQLQRNVEWGQRGNFLEVPTDCPQRDERLGWLGDAQIFIPTACWNADVAAFFTKWMDDVLDARSPRGAFPDVAPLVRRELFAAAAPAWGDAGVIVPWVLYERYGDLRLLAHCFGAMAGWVDYIRDANPDLLWRAQRGNDYGDWLAVGEDTPRDLLATAYFAHCADLVARAARVLGRKEEADSYEELFADIKEAFCDAYLAPSGRLVGHSQTSYVLALAFELLPLDRVPAAADFLRQQIQDRRGFKSDFHPGHLSTGFLGVGHVMPVLTESGHLDLAYRLLENETYPSWGYSVARGATTIWERWDGWTEERGFQDAGMNSFNHYTLGSVGHWLFSTVAGIRPSAASPAFERFVIHPRPGGSITWARAEHDSIRGRIRSGWELVDGRLRLEVEVPANTRAEVWVEGTVTAALLEGGVPVADNDDVVVIGDRDGAAVVEVGGGTYVFE